MRNVFLRVVIWCHYHSAQAATAGAVAFVTLLVAAVVLLSGCAELPTVKLGSVAGAVK